MGEGEVVGGLKNADRERNCKCTQRFLEDASDSGTSCSVLKVKKHGYRYKVVDQEKILIVT